MTAVAGSNVTRELITGRQTTTEQTVATFQIRYRRYLDPSGKPIGDLPEFGRNPNEVVPLYRAMTLTRMFDARAVALQRTGRLGTYPSCLGQEAVAVGLAAAMGEDDVLLPTYREQGAQLWRGVTMTEILQFWGGDERGSHYTGPRRDFPVCIPIASHAVQAAGVATAMKLRHDHRIALCALGDGATSKGDFFEAVNVAGVWKLPVVFVVNNNQWAISVSRQAQTSAETLAQKAIAGGFEGEQVDGNDVIAVRQAVAEAIERARAGQGPALIEALTYRLADHTTADDARRYRAEEEVSTQWSREPMRRLRSFIAALGWWNKSDEEALIRKCKEKVEAAVAAYFTVPPEPLTAIFDHLYENLPATLDSQRQTISGEDDG